MKKLISVLFLAIFFLGCSKSVECSGLEEKKSMLAKLSLDLKKSTSIKEFVAKEFQIYDADYNNLIDDYIEKLEFENVRTIKKDEDLNLCECKTSLKLNNIENLKSLLEEGGKINTDTDLSFQKIDELSKGLNTAYEVQYNYQLTDDKNNYTEILNDNLEKNDEFSKSVFSFLVVNFFDTKIKMKSEDIKTIPWGKNVLIGRFKYRDLEDPIREVVLEKSLVFELEEYVRLPENSSIPEKLVIKQIGIYTKNAKEDFSKIINKKVKITAILNEDGVENGHYPLLANIMGDIKYELIN